MSLRKGVFRAVLFGGTVAMFANPVWSQEAPGEHRQPDRNLTRPGDNENIPGMHGEETTELSKSDMRMVEEALKSKGYNPGKVDGVADDANRAAIRSFQKDKGLPITGMGDKRTADELEPCRVWFGSERARKAGAKEVGGTRAGAYSGT